MRKTILVLSTVGLIAFTSCKNDKTSTETKPEATEQTTKSDVKTPDFESKELKEYMDLYDAYMNDYKAAAESKDMAKFQELATKGQDLATKAQEVSGKLSANDVKKLNEYMSAKSKELIELSKKFTQQ